MSMIWCFLLFQVVQARLHDPGNANLNRGFSLENFRNDQLDLHNFFRNRHDVPKMTLDTKLTQRAQLYAEKLAAKNKGLHHCNMPKCNRYGAGENLASARGSTEVEVNATKLWYNEVWNYDFCSAGKRPGHEMQMIGHFTQVVWKKSTKLGIGYARSKDRKAVYVVARYSKHGNVRGRYFQNIPKPDYILEKYQDNCDGIAGGLSEWSSPSDCTQACGGGIRLKTKVCTNPKPSLNGIDCNGENKEMFEKEWCNTWSCSAEMGHRDRQCKTRGRTPKSHEFGGTRSCILYCLKNGNLYSASGKADDGTHCQNNKGACVDGRCIAMPEYTQASAKPAAPVIKKKATEKFCGEFSGIPNPSLWENKFLSIPDGATNVTITNHQNSNVYLLIGWTKRNALGINFGEDTWMDRIVQMRGSFKRRVVVKGVTFEYERLPHKSTIKCNGPVKADVDYNIQMFVRGKKAGDISWHYTMTIDGENSKASRLFVL